MESNQKTWQLAPDLKICRILNGMWQVAGGHGDVDPESAVSAMLLYHDSGFTAWDMADIYGPAEQYFGDFRKKLEKQRGKDAAEKIQALTKFVPNPGPMTSSIVRHCIEKSIRRMNVESLDVLQFHWWDYADTRYIDALYHLSKLCDEGKIRHVGLTNFDTDTMASILGQGFKLVSNQVQYSIIDQRPQIKMAQFCQKNRISLLTYGTLCGGFLSDKYLGKSEPVRSGLNTYSLQKYKNMIDQWGGWDLFQELLHTLNEIAIKHDSSIANVATRYILDKPAVAGVIIGTRLGISDNRSDNLKVFSLQLDKEDDHKIKSIISRSKDLFMVIGDCGNEYR
ncbi:aldo/keto reductase [Candidatus Nitrosotalea okcheonensis]|uniref:Aldo/keto reductase n=1 Tax=Candidatus Nitrosotalea okcheonensis TaxID=1903276 RepID=A0A2H1FCD4_9ARCH|nr:aldo/keto reductase [Candidatus Nitrosotalea okcheonensis]MDE1728427.1 aldo/keto reductase [Nitrososphaerota archaeon]MDE1831242.1 aldo/keto reductase [Nitrososphaerota archaeon]MDE1841055.1 aldo/keto reductase [Nitrososphaerota archaeon]SMH70425.1 Aldo/keto reductase [Candidatus Nitrosotalea okcheonensis]